MGGVKLFISLIIYIAFGLTVLQLSPQTAHAEIPNQLLEEDQCIICHQEIELMPQDFHESDIHLQAGLSCAGCHGGDPKAEDMEESMSPKKGFIGIPSRLETPKFCGKCHSNIEFMRTYQPRIATDQFQQFYTSVHGKKLRQGDIKVVRRHVRNVMEIFNT
jgi:hypothetical protein